MKALLWTAFLLLLASAGYWYWSQRQSDTGPSYLFASVDRGEIIATVSASGEVEPTTLVSVGSQISGRIVSIRVDFNSVVTRGQLLCELDPIPSQARVAQDEANLTKAKARVKQVQANLDVSIKELERSETLAEKDLIAASELDQERAQCIALRAELELAVAEVAQTEAALQVSQANLSYTRIVSPVDGVVISRQVDVGQTVAASLQAPVLFEIAEDLKHMHVLASVGEADIGHIRMDQPVSFTVDAYPGSPFAGAVKQVRLSPTINQSVVTYTVVVGAENPNSRLLPGMTANLQFETGRTDKNALRIPNAALRYVPEENDERGGEGGGRDDKRGDGQRSGGEEDTPCVWIAGPKGLKRMPVETGMTDREFTELLGGLSEGASIVIGEEAAKASEYRNPFQMTRPGGSGRR